MRQSKALGSLNARAIRRLHLRAEMAIGLKLLAPEFNLKVQQGLHGFSQERQEENCAKFVLEYLQLDGINGNNRINRIQEKFCKNK